MTSLDYIVRLRPKMALGLQSRGRYENGISQIFPGQAREEIWTRGCAKFGSDS